jgi:hypothetical protein
MSDSVQETPVFVRRPKVLLQLPGAELCRYSRLLGALRPLEH